MEKKLDMMPELLRRSAGDQKCCIFRIPRSLVEINKKAYQPCIVSIGPFHHGDSHLRMIEEHKWRFLSDTLNRTRNHGRHLDQFKAEIASRITDIRECYAEVIEFDNEKLIEIMVLDGCFVLELFYKVKKFVQPEMNDPIFSMPWVFPFLMRDFLRLENQIPYFVLEELFKLSKPPPDVSDSCSLKELALRFFNYAVERPDNVLQKHFSLNAQHLLELFRQSFIPDSFPEPQVTIENSPYLQLIPSARTLHLAGIKFRLRKTESYLDIRFKNGLIEIPPLIIDDFTSSVFLNFIAFEQCYSHCTKHFTTYATFMGCLINTPADAEYLRDHKIIENYFGTDEEANRFFKNIGKDVAFDIHRSYLSQLFEDVNKYYGNKYRVMWAEFVNTYFASRWSFVSALAAGILLVLTMIQAFFAVYAYVLPPSNKK